MLVRPRIHDCSAVRLWERSLLCVHDSPPLMLVAYIHHCCAVSLWDGSLMRVHDRWPAMIVHACILDCRAVGLWGSVMICAFDCVALLRTFIVHHRRALDARLTTLRNGTQIHGTSCDSTSESALQIRAVNGTRGVHSSIVKRLTYFSCGHCSQNRGWSFVCPAASTCKRL
jgi:hypothetical protein